MLDFDRKLPEYTRKVPLLPAAPQKKWCQLDLTCSAACDPNECAVGGSLDWKRAKTRAFGFREGLARRVRW